jgi:phosphatidate phosphatase APP1
LITYAGRAVKRRRSVPGGLMLTFYTARLHERGPQLFVSEADWQLYGRLQHLSADRYPDVRTLVGDLSTFPR